MSVKIISNYDFLDRELDRLDGLPDYKTKVAFSGVLREGYVGSQAIVHIETGSLKNSGKTKEKSSRRRWEGTLTYGGPSAGVNNPVDYAIYELARGGDHDFIANTHLLHQQWIQAMKKGLHG